MDDDTTNIWGTPKADVGAGFCKECEREFPFHYSNCPHRTRRVHAAKPGEWPPYEERVSYLMPYGPR